MSVFNNISAIQSRMREIQSKFGDDTATFNPSIGAGGVTPASIQGAGGTSGVTFEQILASKMKEVEGGGSVTADANVKNANLSANAADYDGIVKEAAEKYGVDERFIKAIIQQESGFNPNATSPCGAMGMMQLMPGTAKDLGVANGYDPKENIMGGVKYIKQQLDAFGGDKRKALAAYNAGPGNVMKYGGIPPFAETQNYVKNIMGNYLSMGGNE